MKYLDEKHLDVNAVFWAFIGVIGAVVFARFAGWL
jgi:predicted cobalt transporter CbtA